MLSFFTFVNSTAPQSLQNRTRTEKQKHRRNTKLYCLIAFTKNDLTDTCFAIALLYLPQQANDDTVVTAVRDKYLNLNDTKAAVDCQLAFYLLS